MSLVGAFPIGRLSVGQISTSESVTPDKWFMPLSEPRRYRRSLHPSEQQFLAFQFPFVSFSWFEPLSEPVRPKRGVRTADQQFQAFNPQPFVPREWFQPLSEPVRQHPALRAALQQSYTAPARLLPTPTSFGVLNALETPDTFLAGAATFNRVSSGEAGVVVITAPGTEVSILSANTAAPIASASVSIVIL